LEDLLANPAVQSGVAPFFIALVIGFLFNRVNILAGLCIIAGFGITVLLSVGFNFEPLTSTRKIILLVLLAPCLAIVLQMLKPPIETVLLISYALISCAIIWIFWPVLKRDFWGEIIPVISYMIYASWMMATFIRMTEIPALTASTAATLTGIAVGGAALIGSSALLGQMGMSLAAAGGAFLLVQLMVRSELDAGYTVTLTSGVIAALVLPAAVVYAKVPWIILVMVSAIPFACFYPFEDEDDVWKNTISLVLFCGLFIGAALYVTWQSAGPLLL